MPKLLIVDDEVDITESLVMYFNALGFETYGAKNSAEAFASIAANKPDIALLDVNLRESFSGLDILKKALETRPDMQVIMVTGLGEGDKVTDDCLKLGAKRILMKPLMVDQLAEVINGYAKAVR